MRSGRKGILPAVRHLGIPKLRLDCLGPGGCVRKKHVGLVRCLALACLLRGLAGTRKTDLAGIQGRKSSKRQKISKEREGAQSTKARRHGARSPKHKSTKVQKQYNVKHKRTRRQQKWLTKDSRRSDSQRQWPEVKRMLQAQARVPVHVVADGIQETKKPQMR